MLLSKATTTTGWRDILTDSDRFAEAVDKALRRERGLHGSVGTQNEKVIHAALKNYYAPFSDEQEIKIGGYFADAVCEDGIFEIQTRQLYKLKEKLGAFLEFSRVTVVYPSACVLSTVYINEDNGEIVKETSPRKINSLLKVFEELYSIRGFLNSENLRIIIARLNVRKNVYFRGNDFPNLSSRSVRKRCCIEKIPLEFCDEMILENKTDYKRFLPEGLSEEFSKKDLSQASGESSSSLRLEVLRTVGVIEKTGKNGNSYLYKRSL